MTTNHLIVNGIIKCRQLLNLSQICIFDQRKSLKINRKGILKECLAVLRSKTSFWHRKPILVILLQNIL